MMTNRLTLSTREPVRDLRDIEKDGFAYRDFWWTNAARVPTRQRAFGHPEYCCESVLPNISAAGNLDLAVPAECWM
jgi:hypothetical protein